MSSRFNRPGFIGRDSQLSRIVERVAALNQVLAVIRRAAPPELAPHFQGVAWSGSTLLVAVTSSAVAGRLRMAAPALLAALCDAGWQATAIRPKVQVVLQRENSKRTKQLSLPPAALDAFTGLAQTVENTELREAIQDLLRHQLNSAKK